MDILLLGGTRFIGRALWARLLRAGHRITLVHRGQHPLQLAPAEVEDVLWDRDRFPELPAALKNRRFDVTIDTCAGQPNQVSRFLTARLSRRYLLLSSVDVYRAFGTVLADAEATDPVPISEDAPLRSNRFPFRGLLPDKDNYEKIDCELEALSSKEAEPVVLRLPFVYGPYDYQCREWFFLRRMLRNKPVVMGGSGSWLGTRVYVDEVVRVIESCLDHPKVVGGVYLLGEPNAPTLHQLALQIGEAADVEAEVIEIPDALLPPHLSNYITRPQHLLFSTEKLRHDLGYHEERSPREYLRETVRWHMAHPPYQAPEKAREEEEAEARAVQQARELTLR